MCTKLLYCNIIIPAWCSVLSIKLSVCHSQEEEQGEEEEGVFVFIMTRPAHAL